MGLWSSSADSASCTDCAPGKSAAEGSACEDCATGKYSAQAGSESCTDCGTCKTSEAGSSASASCTDCATGKAKKTRGPDEGNCGTPGPGDEVCPVNAGTNATLLMATNLVKSTTLKAQHETFKSGEELVDEAVESGESTFIYPKLVDEAVESA